jgi:hypothetical protein
MDEVRPFTIDGLQGTRLLLIFSPSVKSPVFESQMRLLNGANKAFEERSLLEVAVLAEGTGYAGDASLDEVTGADLRERYGVTDTDFRVVLVDERGEELHRYDGPVAPEMLYAVLDGGPAQPGTVQEDLEPVSETAHVKKDVEQ